MTVSLRGVVAVVLTYRRPQLATEVVRGLVDREGFDPSAVILVVNGEGGLEDPALEAAVVTVRLRTNLGPAGGFRVGLETAAAQGARWAYMCEDDVGLFDLPTPRVAELVRRVEEHDRNGQVGGVVAYGRSLDPRTGRSVPYVPDDPETVPFPEVDLAAWGASLVRCEVVRRGVLPDPRLFFAFEDFDFWLTLRRHGYRLVLDARTAVEVADRVFFEQRAEALQDRRPVDEEEPWRKYYEARNFFALRRRHGRWSWTLSHLLLTVRRAQLAPTRAHRVAAFHGLWEGFRGRLGRNPRYVRTAGERPVEEPAPGAIRADERGFPPILQVVTDNDRRGAQVFAADLHAALERRGIAVRSVALAPASSAGGLDFEVLGPRRRHSATVRNLRREIRQSAAVIGHGSTTLPLCAIAGAGAKVPFIYRQISDQLYWANTPARRLRVRAALRSADHVVALWSGAAETLTEHFGVPPERITRIPNGVPSERCTPADDAARKAACERFGLDPDHPTLVSIGALVPEKDVVTAVRAMGDDQARGWQLLVIGAGPELPRLRSIAAAIPDRTIVFGEPVTTAAEAMAAADVVVLTSRSESMPAVLIEAGMMGIPVVATRVQGVVEIVLPGETGELVEVGDAPGTADGVARCMAHAETYGKAARTWCTEQFDIDVVAGQWADVLENVLAGRCS